MYKEMKELVNKKTSQVLYLYKTNTEKRIKQFYKNQKNGKEYYKVLLKHIIDYHIYEKPSYENLYIDQ
jgi:hypothetical protein